jgi:hypothetical protein
MSWVAVNANWTATPDVKAASGQKVQVAGSVQALVGASVCRSGSTSGWHCGTIQRLGTTVRYAEGTVNGLTQTNVCAEPGDSGGPFIAGAQAPGVTSGGSGDCTRGGTTFFQPVNPILSDFGLTLRTTSQTTATPAQNAGQAGVWLLRRRTEAVHGRLGGGVADRRPGRRGPAVPGGRKPSGSGCAERPRPYAGVDLEQLAGLQPLPGHRVDERTVPWLSAP